MTLQMEPPGPGSEEDMRNATERNDGGKRGDILAATLNP